MVNAERLRLDEADTGGVPWRRWGLRHADVIGSPYCVRRYVVDAGFGGPDALAVARAALAARGVRLILDYVPNHVAPDHPWVASRPELFVDLGPWQFHLLALQ